MSRQCFLSAALTVNCRTLEMFFGRPRSRNVPLYSQEDGITCWAMLVVLPDPRRHAKDHNLPLVVVGKGSNVLFDDRGFAGVVVVNRICFVKEVPHEASREPTLETRNFHPLTPSARAADPSATRSGAGTNRGEEAESFHLFRAGGGMPFDRLGWHTVRRGWGGLEFATGIPGTVGGAVFMNAGANGMVRARPTDDCCG